MNCGWARMTGEKMSKETTEIEGGRQVEQSSELRKKERHKETKTAKERHGGPSILHTMQKKRDIIKSFRLQGRLSLRKRKGLKSRV